MQNDINVNRSTAKGIKNNNKAITIQCHIPNMNLLRLNNKKQYRMEQT